MAKLKVSFESSLHTAVVEIIRKTSAELPKDVIKAIHENGQREEEASRGRYAMDIIQKKY